MTPVEWLQPAHYILVWPSTLHTISFPTTINEYFTEISLSVLLIYSTPNYPFPDLLPCILSNMVICILCSCVTIDTFLGVSLDVIPHLPFFFLTNLWIIYNLHIYLLNWWKGIYNTSFYMSLLAAHVQNLQY